MIQSPYLNRWDYVLSNTQGVRPAAAMLGTGINFSVPPGNTYGAYATMLTVTEDVFCVVLNFHSTRASATARDMIATLGIDPAGGTNFQDLIPHLICGNAGQYAGSAVGGLWYRFPVFIPAGSSIGMKGSGNISTTVTARCLMWLFGKPSAPELVRYGTYVDAFNIDLSTSSADQANAPAIGTTSEGAWTSLGIESRPHFFWQCGMSVNNTVQPQGTMHIDIGLSDGTGDKYIVLENVDVGYYTTLETQGMIPAWSLGGEYCDTLDANREVFARAWFSGASFTGMSVAAYGVGG